MIVGEGVRNARVAVGISDADVVYTESYYGISFGGKSKKHADLAMCLAGILQSAVASWYLLLTSSEFGIHKRKLLLQDILDLPIPNIERLHSSQAGKLSAAVRDLDWSSAKSFERTFNKIDEAAFDLFDLKKHERLVILDGLERARCEYVTPRTMSDHPVLTPGLKVYSKAFLEVLNAWNAALNRPMYDAEILNVRSDSALRIVRFLSGGSGVVRSMDFGTDLNDVIGKIGNRMKLPIAERLSVARELRVHADGELFIIKPTARRHWSPAAGLNDADAALGDGLEVGPA
jgi:hypothetical protein